MDDLDDLLADLQNSVPCSNDNFSTSMASELENRRFNGSSGYGSLRKKPTLLQGSSTEGRVTPNSQHSYICKGGCCLNNTSAHPSHSHQCQHQETVPRFQNTCLDEDKSFPLSSQSMQSNNSSNLSELDSLLIDLRNARYHTNFDKRDIGKNTFINPSGKLNIDNSFAINTIANRPAMDTLLNEMDGTSTYAASNEVCFDPKSLIPSRKVIITVRETKTEKLGPAQEALPEQYFSKENSFNSTNVCSSKATKELDELMASLSDFKISSSSHRHQTVTDYAKPNKGISHIIQTFFESSKIAEEGHNDQLDSMLGNLQANMSRQGVNTIQKGCCNACEKPIVGQVITALGKTWHPEHFTCNHCSQELGTRNFFERDGYAYCESDYHNLFSPRCAYCNGTILDKCVTALDKTWHTEHFFCAQCGQQFGEDGFHERDGKPYCRNDYFEMFAPKCNGCNRAIMENYISALNSQWHPECFVCRDCKIPVKGKSFYAMEGKPVCPSCVGVDEEDEFEKKI